LRRNGSRRQGALLPLAHLSGLSRARCEEAIRASADSAYLGDHRAICRVLGRYKMFVDTRDLDLSAHLLFDGFWELWVTRTLAQLIRPGMVCVDIGAHIGYFTMLMADLTGETGEVHAFEPNAALRDLLDASARLNGFGAIVRSHPEPLFDADDVAVALVVPPDEPGGGHIVTLGADETGPDALRTRRLDSIAAVARIDLVKIDAEASEEAIWRGMRGLLDQGRPLTAIVEFTRKRYADAGGFLNAMLADGFSLRRIDPERGLLAVERSDVLAARADDDQMLVFAR
jgi:FkbM family methyltransferase